MRRSFLFLRGPPGPFFLRLGEKLRSDGAEVVRVNFSGGDWLDWHGNDTVAYRGTLGDWPAWVKKLAAERRVTDLALYGEPIDHGGLLGTLHLTSPRDWSFR